MSWPASAINNANNSRQRMSEICFLLDERVPLVIQVQLAQKEPKIRVCAIGDSTALPKDTPDLDVLAWIDQPGEFQDQIVHLPLRY